MEARPLTCPRCNAPSVGEAPFCAHCGWDLRTSAPSTQRSAHRRIARGILDRLERIAAGFARLVLAFASAMAVFVAGLFAFAFFGAKPSDAAPWFSLIPAGIVLLAVGRRSEVLFVRHPRFCPGCGEALTQPMAARPTAAARKVARRRGPVAAVWHDVVIVVGALVISGAATFAAVMVIGALGFVRRPSEWILDIVWLFACAVFALVVVRFSEFFRSHGEPSTGPAGNARRFAAALTGATLALFTGYAAVYFGRLDMTFDDFSYVVAFLTVPAVLLVLYGWPRLYRPLVCTPARAAGSFILILSVVVGQGYAIETVARASDCDPLSRSNYPTRMAPDGVAFVEGNIGGIDVLNANGELLGQVVDLAGSWAGSSSLTLSSDRKRIVFDLSTKYSDGSGPGSNIMSVDVDGTHLRVLVSGYPDVENWSPVIDPSGTSVYFLRNVAVVVDGVRRHETSIERLDLNTRRCSPVASAEDVHELVLSPDGTTLAYVQVVDGDARLWRMKTDGSDREPFFGSDDTWVGVHQARFSPNGSRIAFAAYSRETHAASSPTCECGREWAFELFVAPSDGGGARAFASTDLKLYGGIAWSSDNTRVAFRDDAGKIEVLNLADGDIQMLAASVNSNGGLLWLNDVRRDR